MAGRLELKPAKGQRLVLTETPVPGKGEAVEVLAHNPGSTMVHGLTVAIEGEGSEHVELSRDGKSWGAPGDHVKLDPVEAGSSRSFFVRTSYDVEDVEDRLDFELVAAALTLG
jgi:hypothetical protein